MRNKIFWMLRIIFLLSLFTFLFSSYKIFESHTELNSTLNEWEKKKTAKVVESPISTSISIQLTNQEKSDEFKTINTKAIKVEPVKPLYPTTPAKGEVFGKIIIPKIKKEFPIIEGTDQNELAKGVGHYIGSVLPGEIDNTVLAGHRDTVFRELGEVGVGDIVEVETTAGRFTYKIINQRIVHKDDRTVIVSYDNAALTLITCYPFNFVGSAPDRFILVGQLVEE